MNDFAVLANRKCALIALIHSVVFWGVGIDGFASPKPGILQASASLGDFVLIGIYLLVASILGWLVGVSRCSSDRIYFALCATSATFRLFGTIFGDSLIPAAAYLRVRMLSCAVAVCLVIVHAFSRLVMEDVPSE
jgi:hypothetical protein